MSPPTGQQLEGIKQAIFNGSKIEAIKLYREATGLGLKESKEAVEQLEAELRKTEEHRFVQGAAKGGCVGVVMLGLGAVVIGLLAVAT